MTVFDQISATNQLVPSILLINISILFSSPIPSPSVLHLVKSLQPLLLLLYFCNYSDLKFH